MADNRIYTLCALSTLSHVFSARSEINYKLKRLCIQCKLRISVALTEISSSISVFSTPRIQCKVKKNPLQVKKTMYSMQVTNCNTNSATVPGSRRRLAPGASTCFLIVCTTPIVQSRCSKLFQPRKQVTTEPVDAFDVLSDIIIFWYHHLQTYTVADPTWLLYRQFSCRLRTRSYALTICSMLSLRLFSQR